MEHKTFKGWRYKMKYDFDKVWDRVDTDSIKWDRQFKFGVPTGLIPFWNIRCLAIRQPENGPMRQSAPGISAVIMWIFRWRHFHRQKAL